MKKEMPKNLTFKEWEAKKGVIAKMAGETGMGAALKKLDTAWNKITPETLDPDAAFLKTGLSRTPANFDKLMKAAAGQNATVQAARKEFVAVRDLAQSLEKKWKSSRVIPSSSTKYVAEMAKSADWMFIALKSFDRDWTAYGDVIKKEAERQREIGLKAIVSIFKTLRENADEVRKNPTVGQYNGTGSAGFHQNIRGMGAALDKSRNPEWIAWKEKNWKPLAQDAFRPKNDGEVLPKVTQVLKALDELRTVVK